MPLASTALGLQLYYKPYKNAEQNKLEALLLASNAFQLALGSKQPNGI